MKKTNSIIALTLAALVLTACASFRDTFGYSKNRPDEFNVLTNPPLILPPDFNLRPPGSGNRPTSLQGRDLARALVLPKTHNSAGAASETLTAAEQNLLDKASDGNPYGDGIREQIENDRHGTSSRPASDVSRLVKAGLAPARPSDKNPDPDPDEGCRFIICF